jgi:hypothetical protein
LALTLALPSRKMLHIPVATGNVRNFSTFSVCPSNEHCTSARCAYAANVEVNDLDIFTIEAVFLNHTYNRLPKIVNNI